MAAGREAALKIMLEMEGNVEQKTKEVASSLDNLSQAGKVAAGVFGGNLLTGAFNALRNMATQAIGAVKQQFSEMVNMAGEEQVGIVAWASRQSHGRKLGRGATGHRGLSGV
jgi:hypothetical protein